MRLKDLLLYLPGINLKCKLRRWDIFLNLFCYYFLTLPFTLHVNTFVYNVVLFLVFETYRTPVCFHGRQQSVAPPPRVPWPPRSGRCHVAPGTELLPVRHGRTRSPSQPRLFLKTIFIIRFTVRVYIAFFSELLTVLCLRNQRTMTRIWEEKEHN